MIFAQQQNVVSADSHHLHATARAGLRANRPLIGLALEDGGGLGFAHVGVLEWFEENHIPVERIAGTSMGALVGAMYAGPSIAYL
jgi:predicted acylesterase/phospholipase RssA